MARVRALTCVSAASIALFGCATGNRVRTPDQWRDDIQARFTPQLTEFRKCYLATGAPHGKKIEVRVSVSSSTIGFWMLPVTDNTLSGMRAGEIPPAYKQAFHASINVHADIDPFKGKYDIGAETSSTDNDWYRRLQDCIIDVFHKIPVIPDDKSIGSGTWTFLFDPSLPITDVPDPRLPSPSYHDNEISIRLPPGVYAGDANFKGLDVRIVGAGVGATIIDGSLNCDALHCTVHGLTVLKRSKVSGLDADIRDTDFKQGVDAATTSIKR